MNRLKMLFVTPYLPSPPRFGGQRRLAGLMEGLARSHEVSVLSFVDPREDVESSIRATEAYCKKVVAVPNERLALTTRRKRLLQMRSLLSRRSFGSFVYRSATLTEALHGLLARKPYDIVHFEFAQMAANRPPPARPSLRRPIFVLDEHNIEYDIVRRTAGPDQALDRRFYNSLDWRKLRAEEQGAWRRVDGCTLTSARDEELLRREFPAASTAVVPNAVDVDFFRPGREGGQPDPMTLVFFGSLNYHPNTDGLLFFLQDVLPRLKARHPRLKLRIVGQQPPPEIEARAGDGVELTGLVDDVRPYIERATVIIAPLRIGGGTRFKILEAMAMGKAVVSTAIGAEGIEVRHESDILIADEPEAFAAQVGRLLGDAELRRRMGAAARSLIERRYSWAASVARLEEFHAVLLARRRTST